MVLIFPSQSSPKSLFLAYIQEINNHVPNTPLDLSKYMQPILLVNNKTFSLSQYEESLLVLINAAPDFKIRVQLLVVEGTTIATRFLVSCTPRSQFKGYPSNGKRIEYAEHVFYHLEGGKISEVSALIDVEAIKRQLTVEFNTSTR
ncbi:hypothetical protein GcM1_133001 [Golovinomyces cichoracearum]|uniref:Ester cyclase n=1 Tax=Golovinomyces cichoracearum TaxID=62708 RepID=A0A420JBU3_9PEZI|nr:hypothetical protein GcM1_133001 [Golovinomyces cichoracearum]